MNVVKPTRPDWTAESGIPILGIHRGCLAHLPDDV